MLTQVGLSQRCMGVLVLWIFFHFLLSLKSFPNKTLILNALPHLRESSLPSISVDLLGNSNHLCHCLELLSTPCVLGMWGCHFPAPHVEGSHSTGVQGAVRETIPEGLGIGRAVVS